MPMQVVIPLQIPSDHRINASWGSLFHGALMEQLPIDLADELHVSALKPWSQYLTVSQDGKVYWVLNTLSEPMTQAIEEVLLKKLPTEWLIRQKGIKIQMGVPVSIERASYRELADRAFSRQDVQRKYQVVFSTPTTFKTAGEFVLFPSTDLLFNSLAQKWDAFATEISLYDPEVRAHLGTHVLIKKYRLASVPFSVDSSWLTGFEGKIEIGIRGPEALCRVADLLLSFGKYSGVGIKTALGMGGLTYEELRTIFPARDDRPIS